MTSLGAHGEQARIHVLIAGAARLLGDPARERGQLEQALAIYAELGAPETEELRHRLGTDIPGAPAERSSRHENDRPGS